MTLIEDFASRVKELVVSSIRKVTDDSVAKFEELAIGFENIQMSRKEYEDLLQRIDDSKAQNNYSQDILFDRQEDNKNSLQEKNQAILMQLANEIRSTRVDLISLIEQQDHVADIRDSDEDSDRERLAMQLEQSESNRKKSYVSLNKYLDKSFKSLEPTKNGIGKWAKILLGAGIVYLFKDVFWGIFETVWGWFKGSEFYQSTKKWMEENMPETMKLINKIKEKFSEWSDTAKKSWDAAVGWAMQQWDKVTKWWNEGGKENAIQTLNNIWEWVQKTWNWLTNPELRKAKKDRSTNDIAFWNYNKDNIFTSENTKLTDKEIDAIKEAYGTHRGNRIIEQENIARLEGKSPLYKDNKSGVEFSMDIGILKYYIDSLIPINSYFAKDSTPELSTFLTTKVDSRFDPIITQENIDAANKQVDAYDEPENIKEAYRKVIPSMSIPTPVDTPSSAPQQPLNEYKQYFIYKNSEVKMLTSQVNVGG